MAIIPTLFKRCSGPLKKATTQVGSYISHECKITPSDSDASEPIWRRPHQDEALGNCTCAPGSG